MLAELAMQRFGASLIQQVKATRDWYREACRRSRARFEESDDRDPA
jgi:phage FluMu gp28-like protein